MLLKSTDRAAAALCKDQGRGLRRHGVGRGQTPLSSMIQTEWPKFQVFGTTITILITLGRGRKAPVSGRAVAEHPLLCRLCQPPLEGSVRPTWRVFDPLEFHAL